MTFQPENISGDRESTSQPNLKIDHSLDRLVDLLLDRGEGEQPRTPTNRCDRPSESSLNTEPEEVVDYDSNLTSEFPELDVQFTPKATKNLTLREAVAYEAFLRQTVDEHNISSSQIDFVQHYQPTTYSLADNVETDREGENNSSADVDSVSEILPEQLAEIQENLHGENLTVGELADTVNALIPLIVELLNYKLGDTRESVLQAVIPVIDRIIQQRTTEDATKMAAAIAPILPHAISEKIQVSPQAMAKAIAPEIALAIEEQIRLDRDAISKALGSEMGKAIKTQIELEKDAMVDALYPVIGNTISKYMVEVVHEINHKVETALSTEGFKRKIRAKLQGVSEAELILQEAINYHVQAVFLIDKDSGLIIQEIQPNSQQHLQSDLVAGMLTAIRSFANDCIATGSELDTIDYGDWQIPIEVAGYCYIAVVVRGEPSKKFRAKIRQVLSTLVLKYGNEIENYQGDRATVPEAIQTLLSELVEPENSKNQSKSPPTTLIWLLAIILGLIFIPWGVIAYRSHVAARIERETAVQLDAAPQLSVYRLEPEVHRGKLTLTGRVPNEYLRSQATNVVQPIADRAELQLDNQIIAVNVPVDLNSTKGEIERLTAVFNRQPDISITTEYREATLTINGFILNQQDLQTAIATFKTIPGVKTIVVAVEDKLPSFEERIYFQRNSAQLNPVNRGDSLKINNIKVFLERYPQLNLRLIAHSDPLEQRIYGEKLAQQRLNNLKNSLIAKGVNSDQLQLDISDRNAPDLAENSPEWLNRCIRFESFIPTN